MEIKKQLLLSFVIPTYNFSNFIAATVESIENGAKMLKLSQFEVVILDGGSNDNTDNVVCPLIDLYKNIRYIKQAKRGGIDGDMDTAAGIAAGKYIWLFSADDVLECGWDKHLVPLLARGGDVFLVPATLCDIRMTPLRQNPIFKNCIIGEPVNFNIFPGDASLHNYLNQAATLEALFSYISSIVVNADIWRGLPVRKDYFGSNWAHCARLMPLFFRKTKITYLNKFLIKKRSGNDSFMENGFVARVLIAIEGWNKIIKEFFVDASDQQVLYNRLRKDIQVLLFYSKISAQQASEIERLNTMAGLLYSGCNPSTSARISYFIYRLIPRNIILNSIIRPFLPVMIRLRHKIKAVFV
jgi:glycosyltransferase involved in cell wall biosynthesis